MTDRTIQRDLELREIYDTEVEPLIRKKDYDNAFILLATQPELKDYLSHEELRTMYDFTEPLLFKMLNSVLDEIGTSAQRISEKLKGLEGRTE